MAGRLTSDIASRFATALDGDDFAGLLPMLDDDVVYRIGNETHRGPSEVIASYRSGSELARRLFDRVEFSHRIIGTIAERTVRIDFSDILHVGDEQLEHHSIQDVVVGDDDRIESITDRPVAGERERVDAFMARHGLTREGPSVGT